MCYDAQTLKTHMNFHQPTQPVLGTYTSQGSQKNRLQGGRQAAASEHLGHSLCWVSVPHLMLPTLTSYIHACFSLTHSGILCSTFDVYYCVCPSMSWEPMLLFPIFSCCDINKLSKLNILVWFSSQLLYKFSVFCLLESLCHDYLIPCCIQ